MVGVIHKIIIKIMKRIIILVNQFGIVQKIKDGEQLLLHKIIKMIFKMDKDKIGIKKMITKIKTNLSYILVIVLMIGYVVVVFGIFLINSNALNVNQINLKIQQFIIKMVNQNRIGDVKIAQIQITSHLNLNVLNATLQCMKLLNVLLKIIKEGKVMIIKVIDSLIINQIGDAKIAKQLIFQIRLNVLNVNKIKIQYFQKM